MAEATKLRQINKEVQDFRYKQIQVVPGLSFNQYDTLNQIYFYYNSRFSTGGTDDEGDRKYFFNINKNPCLVYTKSIDFDTKDIKLLTTEEGDVLKTWFMERDLKYWMKDKQFGKVLNRIFKELPIFGSVVLKIVNGEPFFVDLRNFIVEQSAESLDVSNYIIEIHNKTVPQFRKIAKVMNWKQKDIDDVIKKYHEMKETSHIRLYERYGEVEITDEKGNKTYPYRRTFVADVGVDQYDQQGYIVQYAGVELSSEDWKEHPYWEFHTDKMSGRWLGTGVVEQLFEPQIRENEIANLQSKTSYWAALRVFQTRDQSFNRNLSTDVRNGEVFNVESEITQVDMSDRNLAFFGQEHDKWMANRNELTFAFDISEGQGVRGGRSAQAHQIASTMAAAYFGLIQENIALDIKEMLYQVILPQFQKDNTQEHTLRLIGQDLDRYVEMVKNELVLKEVIRIAISTKEVPTNAEKDAIGVAVEQSIKQHKEKVLTIPKDFYKNVKFDVDIDITQESVDVRERSATRFAILQAITADPTSLTDPVKKKILYGMAEDGGINPNDFFSSESAPQQIQAPQQGAGGGVSRPAFESPLAGTSSKTI